ncbi:hypothetical protein ACFY05_30045 [Microtetraspora fusca]|uniref:DUF5709 domain-containing protein n=1 Tax=Microtetraspora fusca TaxID=1997 RepID=A0ABW6VCN7_MICFU
MTRSSEQRAEGSDREPVRGAESVRRSGPGSPQPEPDRPNSDSGSEGLDAGRDPEPGDAVSAAGQEQGREQDREQGREQDREQGQETAGQAVPPGRPERAVRASGPPLTPERARSAHDASQQAERAPEHHEIYPGGTIETALTPSGEPSMVASQLLWDGSIATSRLDQAIAEAIREHDEDADEEDGDTGPAPDRRARPDTDRP